LGPGHRREGSRRPHRHRALGRAAAGPPGPSRAGRRGARRGRERPLRPRRVAGARRTRHRTDRGCPGRRDLRALSPGPCHTDPETCTEENPVSALDFPQPSTVRRIADDERARVLAAPGFGTHFTDFMAHARWTEESGWGESSVLPYGPLQLSPAAAVLHYGQEIFEGLKAFRRSEARRVGKAAGAGGASAECSE